MHNQLRTNWKECDVVGEELHVDYMFMPGPSGAKVPYLLAIDRCTGAMSVHSHSLTSRKTIPSRINILAAMNMYKLHGHATLRIVCDDEGVFLANVEYFASVGVELINAAAYRHASVVERGVRVLKERFRATLLELKYKLPKRLYSNLLMSICESFNMLPDLSFKDTVSPIQRITGEKVSYKLALRYAFGQFVSVHNPNHAAKAKGEVVSRIQCGIVVGRNYKNGSVTIWSIPDAQYINRDVVYATLLTDLVIESINGKAAMDDKHYSTIPPIHTKRLEPEGTEDRVEAEETGADIDVEEDGINEDEALPPVDVADDISHGMGQPEDDDDIGTDRAAE
jgi:hypothetical protein